MEQSNKRKELILFNTKRKNCIHEIPVSPYSETLGELTLFLGENVHSHKFEAHIKQTIHTMYSYSFLVCEWNIGKEDLPNPNFIFSEINTLELDIGRQRDNYQILCIGVEEKLVWVETFLKEYIEEKTLILTEIEQYFNDLIITSHLQLDGFSVSRSTTSLPVFFSRELMAALLSNFRFEVD